MAIQNSDFWSLNLVVTGVMSEKNLIKLESFKQLHPEIAYRILTKLLLEIGGHPYPLPYKSLKNLYYKIVSPDFIGATGGGCYLKKVKGGLIEVRKEQRKVKNANSRSYSS